MDDLGGSLAIVSKKLDTARDFYDRLQEAARERGIGDGPTAIGKALGVNKQTVAAWKTSLPRADKLFEYADKLGVAPRWLATGEQPKALEQEPAAQGTPPLGPKEELLVELFRGLVDHQQRELVSEVRALYNANQEIRKQLNGARLQLVSNEAVEKAFGQVPAPQQKRIKPQRRRTERRGHMGDPDVE